MMIGTLAVSGKRRSLRQTSMPDRLSIIQSSTTKSGGVSRASRSEEHTSELQTIMRISHAVVGLKNKMGNAILPHKFPGEARHYSHDPFRQPLDKSEDNTPELHSLIRIT